MLEPVGLAMDDDDHIPEPLTVLDIRAPSAPLSSDPEQPVELELAWRNGDEPAEIPNHPTTALALSPTDIRSPVRRVGSTANHAVELERQWRCVAEVSMGGDAVYSSREATRESNAVVGLVALTVALLLLSIVLPLLNARQGLDVYHAIPSSLILAAFAWATCRGWVQFWRFAMPSVAAKNQDADEISFLTHVVKSVWSHFAGAAGP